MVRWLGILIRTLRSAVRTHRELALENLALRQQPGVWKARQPRPRLTAMDRLFWILLSRLWKGERHDGDPGGVRRLLQQDSDPLIVDQGRTRATERAAAKPGQGGGGATHTPCLSSTWHRRGYASRLSTRSPSVRINACRSWTNPVTRTPLIPASTTPRSLSATTDGGPTGPEALCEIGAWCRLGTRGAAMGARAERLVEGGLKALCTRPIASAN